MTINLNGLGIDYGVILPEIIVVITAIVVLGLDLVIPVGRRNWRCSTHFGAWSTPRSA